MSHRCCARGYSKTWRKSTRAPRAGRIRGRFEEGETIRDADLVAHYLKRMREFRDARLRDADLARRQRRLTRWQSARLARTHADLLRHPRSRGAIEFFLENLYAPKDFTRRDQDLERIAPILTRILPASSLRTIAMALEMNVVTEEVDAALLEALADLGYAELDEESYLEAYRRCDDRPRRLRQIELIWEVGMTLDKVVRLPGAYAALRLAGGPARLAGLGELQKLLENGFRTFRKIGGARDFLAAIVETEKEVLRRIYDGHPRPFE